MNKDRPDTFLLDTNIFIEAHRRYYSLDLCPGFWDCLTHYCHEPRLLSIDRVRAEINEGDALHDWIQGAPDALFVSTTEEAVVNRFAEMMGWVQQQAQFNPEAKAEFAQVADGWLMAYASIHGHAVVTHEVFDPNIKRKVPMPNVCREFGVDNTDTFSMLRTLDVRFGWAR